MKDVKYEELTIENAQSLIKTGLFSEIIFNADNKTISILEDEYKKIEKVFEEVEKSFRKVADAVCKVSKEIWNILKQIASNLDKELNRKMTKKKFIKLLQSEGIQRNTINEITKNNKEEYTYLRYYKELERLSKDKGE